METISIYEALNFFPKTSLRTLAVQSVHKCLTNSFVECGSNIALHPFDEAAYQAAQKCIYERIEEIRSEYVVPDPIKNAWKEYCDFWMALSKTQDFTEEEKKLYTTFCNYINFSTDVHNYGTRIPKQKIKVVELGAGYGFSSYAMTCMGYMVLGLANQGRSSWYSWLMDRFMLSTLPVLFKDTYSYHPMTLGTVTERFGSVDIFCMSGLPIFPAFDTISDSFKYVVSVIFEFLEHIEPGGFLICKSMNFFPAQRFTENQRKAAFFELISFLNDIPGIECLEFGSDKEQKTDFPNAWRGFDLGLVLQKQ